MEQAVVFPIGLDPAASPVGIDLIFDGWSLVMTGMAARQLPA